MPFDFPQGEVGVLPPSVKIPFQTILSIEEAYRKTIVEKLRAFVAESLCIYVSNSLQEYNISQSEWNVLALHGLTLLEAP